MPTERRRHEWEAKVRALVDQAPPLTPEQADRLAVLLRVETKPGKKAAPRGANGSRSPRTPAARAG